MLPENASLPGETILSESKMFNVFVKNTATGDIFELPYISISFTEELNAGKDAKFSFDYLAVKDIADKYNTSVLFLFTAGLREIYIEKNGTKIYFGAVTDYTLVRQRGAYEIQVHERVIDDKIRRGGFTDMVDYQEQFLKHLNRSVSSGMAKGLLNEKLGFTDQRWSYFAYAFYFLYGGAMNAITKGSYAPSLFDIGYVFMFYTPFIQFNFAMGGHGNKEYPHVRTNWREAFLPLVPIDRWARGRLFLARHGNELFAPVNR